MVKKEKKTEASSEDFKHQTVLHFTHFINPDNNNNNNSQIIPSADETQS